MHPTFADKGLKCQLVRFIGSVAVTISQAAR